MIEFLKFAAVVLVSSLGVSAALAGLLTWHGRNTRTKAIQTSPAQEAGADTKITSHAARAVEARM